MKEMQRIAGVPEWIPMAQCKWEEVKDKIVEQARLEAANKSHLRQVVQEAEDGGLFLLMCITNWIEDWYTLIFFYSWHLLAGYYSATLFVARCKV